MTCRGGPARIRDVPTQGDSRMAATVRLGLVGKSFVGSRLPSFRGAIVRGCPHPSPLDSGLRENDEVGWWPAGVGLPRPRPGCPQGTPLRLFWRMVGRRWALLGRPVWVRRAPRPGRFVNRPYGDVGEWWDAGGQYRAGSDAGGSDQLLLFRRLVTLVIFGDELVQGVHVGACAGDDYVGVGGSATEMRPSL